MREQQLRSAAALSAAFPDQPQQRGYASQPPWWQFWQRREEAAPCGQQQSEGGGDGGPPASGGGRLPWLPSSKHLGKLTADERELNAVKVAAAVNITIFVAKLGAWLATSSGAMLAEALHSAADVANQLLLLAGVQRSKRLPTRIHPYGFSKEKYVYALISAVGVFCLGAGASFVNGVQQLLAPGLQLENMGLSLAVLAGSSALEVVSLRVAFRHLREGARERGMSIWQYVRRGRDPATSAIVAEDAGAVAGLGIAGLATWASWVTGHAAYDALGACAVGCLMGGIAIYLIRTNKRFLLGQAMDKATEQKILDYLQADKMVLKVIDPKSEEIGDGIFRYKAEIQWSGDCVVDKYLEGLGRDSVYAQLRSAACRIDIDQAVMQDAMDYAMRDFGRGVIRTVGEEIDRIEMELKALVPGLEYVDLETDRGHVLVAPSTPDLEQQPGQQPGHAGTLPIARLPLG
eukprot:scaffold11.g4011.t1